MSSSHFGLHSAQTYFLSSKRKHEQALRSYDEWLAKRHRAKQNLIDQIESIKQTSPSSKRSEQLLGRLEYQLATMESEDAEEADPEFLKRCPNAYKCYRPAYVKLTFENTIAATEKATKTAEEAYRTTLKLKEESGELPSYMRKGLDPECLFTSPPSSPEVGTQAEKTPKQSIFQKISGFLDKLELDSRQGGMTKTFPTRPLEGSTLNNNKWAFRANTYYPRNAYPDQHSPSAS